MQLLLKNGRVIDPSRNFDEVIDVLIKNGKVYSFVKDYEDNLDNTIDCTGCIISPGFIDVHVHTREPGYEYKEDIFSASEAAAAGGFTTIVGMQNTKPAIDNRAIAEFVINKGKQAKVNFFTTAAATKANEGKELADIGDMVDAGAVAVSDDAFPVQNTDLMRLVMQYTKMFDVPIMAHCEDKSLTKDAITNEGALSTMLGLKAWPRQAEELMIIRNIMLAELTGCKLHIQHVTTRGGVEAIRWGKSKGIKLTAETCPQYFSLTDEALSSFDTNAKMCPPLRTSDDIEAIKEALADGTIDILATDHAPHAQHEKEVELQYAPFGIIGLETALALSITNLVDKKVLSLTDMIKKFTIEPAKLIGIDRGTIAEGSVADITVFDPNADVTVDKSKFKSKSKNTPFDGFKLKGKVVATIVGGEVV